MVSAARIAGGEKMRKKDEKKRTRSWIDFTSRLYLYLKGMTKSRRLTPVKLVRNFRISQETMMPIRPKKEEPRVEEAWASFFSSPPPKR